MKDWGGFSAPFSPFTGEQWGDFSAPFTGEQWGDFNAPFTGEQWDGFCAPFPSACGWTGSAMPVMSVLSPAVQPGVCCNSRCFPTELVILVQIHV